MNPPRRSLDPDRTITVVSGLPRSGTSMMMQMLSAAGLPIATDDRRIADDDNPKGYYELEAVKTLREDASFLAEATGRVVKIVAPLLPFLSTAYDYRIVFMERDLAEVLASQSIMLGRRQGIGSHTPDDGPLTKAFAHQLERVKLWLADRDNVATCFVSHRRAITSPTATALAVAAFLEETGAFETLHAGSAARALAATRMCEAIDPALHRQRRA